ncbi:hypothetical protein OIU84_002986, partial [Salix udensis]
MEPFVYAWPAIKVTTEGDNRDHVLNLSIYCTRKSHGHCLKLLLGLGWIYISAQIQHLPQIQNAPRDQRSDVPYPHV